MAVGGLLILSVVSLALSHANHDIAREHGPMENLQSAFLFTAFLVLLRHAIREKNLANRILYAGMAAGHFTFLALEFDVRPLESKWLTLVFNGPIRNAWMLLAWAIIAFYAFKNLPQVLAAFHRWRRTSSALLLAFSALFWIAGAVAEKFFSKLNPNPYFLEEFMEGHAAWLMLLAAISLKTSQPWKDELPPVPSPATQKP